MRVMADICIVPIGVGISLSEYVAACERVLRDADLRANLHAFGTNVEGEWDQVMDALRACHEAVHAMGAPRVHTTIRMGTRTDREQTLADKVESVEKRL
jgi:uncharacterized protein (TIGR00106 family)